MFSQFASQICYWIYTDQLIIYFSENAIYSVGSHFDCNFVISGIEMMHNICKHIACLKVINLYFPKTRFIDIIYSRTSLEFVQTTHPTTPFMGDVYSSHHQTLLISPNGVYGTFHQFVTHHKRTSLLMHFKHSLQNVAAIGEHYKWTLSRVGLSFPATIKLLFE